jgi:hypothetical protein
MGDIASGSEVEGQNRLPALDDTTLINLVHNLMVNWSRSLTVLASSLMVFFIGVTSQSEVLPILGISIGLENFMAALAILYSMSSLHIIHVLSSLSRVFENLEVEYKVLFQVFIRNEGGIFNAFGMNRSGIVPAIPFGMLVALLLTVTLQYGFDLDIFLSQRSVLDLILPYFEPSEYLAAGFVTLSTDVAGDSYEEFTSYLWKALLWWMVFLFLYTLYRLVQTMNLVLGHGSPGKFIKPGYRFVLAVVATTWMSMFFLFMLIDGRSGNGPAL